MRTCQSLITTEFGRGKAKSQRPPRPFANPQGYPICGGKLTFSIENWLDMGLEVLITCSRCKCPYFDGIDRNFSIRNHPLAWGINPEGDLHGAHRAAGRVFCRIVGIGGNGAERAERIG